MHWIILYPSIQTGQEPWLHTFVPGSDHSFDLLVAGYSHDRSRDSTSARQWLEILRHALRGWWAARRAWARGQAVGILCGFPQLTVCAGLLARLTGASWPIVGWSFNLGTVGGPIRRALAGFALRRVNRLVVHSTAEIAVYAEAFGLRRERLRFVPFALPDLTPTEDEDTAAPFLIAMGSAGRDYPTLAEALRRLDIPAVIVSAPHAVAGVAWPPGVEVRSALSEDECWALAQRARLTVVPLAEGATATGQVTVLAAMLLGRCVVATRTVGTRDYVDEGRTGLLVPPGDAEALAKVLRDLWDDPAQRAAVGRAARDDIRARAIHPVIGQTMGALLSEAAKEAEAEPAPAPRA